MNATNQIIAELKMKAGVCSIRVIHDQHCVYCWIPYLNKFSHLRNQCLYITIFEYQVCAVKLMDLEFSECSIRVLM